ncbi:MAG TPA: class I SAM-dependent methyltransferase [Flavobacterium sp.]|nr:class I SAM-dependent methyltransferase [Flavobacterium sp.]
MKSDQIMRDFWNKRYDETTFAYGENPNAYFADKIPSISASKILFPCEGEGRNAVYAAQLGCEVHAFDLSESAKKKAEILVKKYKVNIDYVVSELKTIDYPAESFDALVLIFAHFSAEKRKEYHQKLIGLLKKDGILILEGFSKKHQKYQSENPQAGGPQNPEMLYDLEDLKTDFTGFDFVEAYETDTELKEGLYHVGKASVVRIMAIKK